MKGKLLALLLTFSMVFTLVSGSTLALEEDSASTAIQSEDDTGLQTEQNASEVEDTGDNTLDTKNAANADEILNEDSAEDSSQETDEETVADEILTEDGVEDSSQAASKETDDEGSAQVSVDEGPDDDLLKDEAVTEIDLAATSDLQAEELAMIYDEANYKGNFVPGEIIIGFNETNDIISSAETSARLASLDVLGINSRVKKLDKDLMAQNLEEIFEADKVDLAIDEVEMLLEASDVGREVCWVSLDEKTEEAVLNAIEALKYDPNIAYVQPNYIYTTMDTETKTMADSSQIAAEPTDPYYDLQYGMERIQAPYAWNFQTGSASVLVGVLDTGVDYSHEDLAENVSTDLAFDAVDGEDAMDYQSHGTHVAGIIGAVGNSIGVTGVCWDVTIVPIRVLNDKAYGTTDQLIAGIKYATAKELPIINMSLGNYEFDTACKSTIEAYPGLVVVAAGNSDFDLDKATESSVTYPASYDTENMLVVGNSTSNDDSSTSSNYGAKTVDLFAPGTEIYSTVLDDSYDYKTGTSMAAPHVAGTAALLLSQDPSLTTAELKEAILSTVDPVDALTNLCSTGGRLNAFSALKSISGESIVHTYSELSSALKGSSLTIWIANDITFTGTLFVNRSVILAPYEADSVTLTAASGYRHFNTTGSDMTIELTGVTLNGNSLGGGIYNTGTLALKGGTISGNKASLGGGIQNTGTLKVSDSTICGNTGTYGGGIYNKSGKLTMSGGEISGNVSTSQGGGIFNLSGTVEISNEIISVNKGPYGGGIYCEGSSSKLEISSGSVDNNSGSYGGGIYNKSGTLAVSNGTISGNTATSYGGGLYTTGTSSITISGTLISGNTSSSYGGGIYNYNGPLSITNGTISSNSAGNGGGIYSTGSSSILNISSGTISGNKATGSGGGIYQTGTLTATNVTIKSNTASNGGGINNNGNGTTTITGGTISNNSAPYGGGIYQTGTLKITNGTISGNSATGTGGGIRSSGTLTMSGGIISNNSAGAYGGGISNSSGTLTMSGGTISNNSAGTYGGGISNSSGTLTMSGGTISSNSAGSGGGGLYNTSSGTLSISNGTISINKGTTYGGGILNHGTLKISGGTISGNSAKQGGGIDNNTSGIATITGGTISSNTATGGGGGINNISATLTISGGEISSNSATNGGGINNSTDATLKISSGTIKSNMASSYGGGIYNHTTSAGVTRTGGTISGNSPSNTYGI